jgi:hypothetical protein
VFVVNVLAVRLYDAHESLPRYATPRVLSSTPASPAAMPATCVPWRSPVPVESMPTTFRCVGPTGAPELSLNEQ